MAKIRSINIASRKIGLEHPPFIIAEMSGNHNQSLERALAIVEEAAGAGAHALKLQTYTADTMTLDVDAPGFRIEDENSLWYGRTLYELYEEAHTPWDWHEPIMNRANKLGLICFSTPFDESAVDFLEDLHVPAYKIASFENTDVNLIRKVSATGKPVIISIGMASVEDIELATQTARDAGCRDLILLKCTSSYPASPEDCNVLTLPDMRARFDCEVGLSDHTLGIGAAMTAVAHGAVVIEKHFTLNREEGGVDVSFSMEPLEFRQLIDEGRTAWQALGQVKYGACDTEKPSIQFRRSIYVVENIAKGEKFTTENIRCIRPGLGAGPKLRDQIIGCRATRDLRSANPLSVRDVEGFREIQ